MNDLSLFKQWLGTSACQKAFDDWKYSKLQFGFTNLIFKSNEDQSIEERSKHQDATDREEYERSKQKLHLSNPFGIPSKKQEVDDDFGNPFGIPYKKKGLFPQPAPEPICHPLPGTEIDQQEDREEPQMKRPRETNF